MPSGFALPDEPDSGTHKSFSPKTLSLMQTVLGVILPVTLMNMIDYIHANPVRRGLVERASDWEWSSAAFLQIGGDSLIPVNRIPPEWVP